MTTTHMFEDWTEDSANGDVDGECPGEGDEEPLLGSPLGYVVRDRTDEEGLRVVGVSEWVFGGRKLPRGRCGCGLEGIVRCGGCSIARIMVWSVDWEQG